MRCSRVVKSFYGFTAVDALFGMKKEGDEGVVAQAFLVMAQLQKE
jgi:hypothetical protein